MEPLQEYENYLNSLKDDENSVSYSGYSSIHIPFTASMLIRQKNISKFSEEADRIRTLTENELLGEYVEILIKLNESNI